MSFVTCKYSGRLGNQLFQAAATIAHATRNGARYLLPPINKSKYTKKPYLKHLPTLNDERIKFVYEEPADFTYQPIPFVPDMELVGYFQTEKHFKDQREEVIKAFGFEIKRSEKVSIHVRRGDYLSHPTKHPVVSKEYILAAMQVLGYQDYLFFSDDIDWCKENFPGHEYSEGNDQFTDLILMAGCKHNIIANSSFSWWGAWLNPNPDKIVIAPEVWFGPGNSHLKTENIIPEDWVKL